MTAHAAKRVWDRGQQLTLVLRAQLGSPTRKVVLMVLLDFYGQNGRCTVSHQTIADCANLTRRAVMKAVKELSEMGVVSVTARVDDAGDRTSNRYDLHFARLEELQPIVGGEPDAPPPCADQAQGGEPHSRGGESGSPLGSEPHSPPGEPDAPRVVNDVHHGGERRSQEPPIGTAQLNRERAAGAASARTAGADSSRRKPRDAIRWSAGDGWEGITDQDRSRWAAAYPACDIGRQLAAMNEWLLANPAKAHKTQWLRFITNWLSRSQERGGDVKSNSNRAGTGRGADERRSRVAAAPGKYANVSQRVGAGA